jgi:hypothetical protein
LSSAHLRRRGLPQSPKKWQDVLGLLPSSFLTFTSGSRSRKCWRVVDLMVVLLAFLNYSL